VTETPQPLLAPPASLASEAGGAPSARGVLAYIRSHRRAQAALLLGPAFFWVVALVVAPAGLMFATSFWRVENYEIVRDWNLDSYRRILERPVYYGTLLISMRIAGAVTFCTLALAIPLAYVIAFKITRHKTIWFALVVVSLWVGYLMRAYAWRIILGQNGILNGFLIDIGVVAEPLEWLLFSPVAVVIALTHLATPFALMPIYATFEQVPKALHEAAADLGAGPLRTAWFVTMPLTLHGIITGAAFAFILAFGDFLAPLLVGGPDGIMISNVAASQFGTAFQWPLGSAIAVMMFLVIVVVLLIPTLVERLVFRRARHTTTPYSSLLDTAAAEAGHAA
jgi:spermidine/putrescine transport system permease protein